MAETRKIVVAATACFINKMSVNIEEEEYEDDVISDSDDIIFIGNFWREQKHKIHGYSEKIVELYSDADFQGHFRLKRCSFEKLLDFLNQKSIKKDSAGNPQITLKKQLEITLWILGNQEVYRSVADRFGVCVSTAWQSVFRICNLLVDNRKEFIQWPKGERAKGEMRKFRQICGFPGVVGAIDGTYVPISAPTNHPESYICRKNFHALNMQAVCTSDLKFISVDIGSPGSMHDARVLRRSYLYEMIREHKNLFFPGGSHMIGDSAYPLSEILLVPCKKRGILNASQKLYNKKLSTTRVVIERAFGLLKSRFRRLKYIYMYRTDQIPLIVLACVILHNICIEYGDECDEEVTVEDEEEPDIIGQDVFADGTRGKAKRNFIMSYLRTNT